MSVLWLSSVLDIRSISFYPSPVMSQRGPLAKPNPCHIRQTLPVRTSPKIADLSKMSILITLREANSDGVHPHLENSERSIPVPRMQGRKVSVKSISNSRQLR